MVSVFVHTTPRDVTVSSAKTSTMISLGDQQGRMPLMLVKVGIKKNPWKINPNFQGSYILLDCFFFFIARIVKGNIGKILTLLEKFKTWVIYPLFNMGIKWIHAAAFDLMHGCLRNKALIVVALIEKVLYVQVRHQLLFSDSLYTCMIL